MRAIFLVVVSFLATFSLKAQNDIFSQNKIFVDEKSKMILPAAIAKNLVITAKYTISKITKSDTVYLKEMNEEEREKLFEKIPIIESPAFKTGKKIGSFSAETIYGKKIKVTEKLGKVVVLNFWFIDCQPCRMEIPELNEIHKEFKDSNVVFLGIALDEKYELQEFFKTTKFDYTIVDNGRYITDRFGIKGYPTHVIIDATGKIVFNSRGYSPNLSGHIRKNIRAALRQTTNP